MRSLQTGVIAQALKEYKDTRKLRHLIVAGILVVRQGRSREVVYSIWCQYRYKPEPIHHDLEIDVDELIAMANKKFELVNSYRLIVLKDTLRYLKHNQWIINTTIHGFTYDGENFIVGEYADNSARIFLKCDAKYYTSNYYRSDTGVRHIHSILQIDRNVYVSTGDTKKYLDLFEIVDGTIRFSKRLMKNYAGFTGCCVIGSELYFGTDFSERPNYIFHLESGSRYFFPGLAFRQFCKIMFEIDDRYIFCLCSNLETISDSKSIVIFDTYSKRFIYYSPYVGDFYLC